MSDVSEQKNNCSSCRHKDAPDAAHCFLYMKEPEAPCQHYSTHKPGYGGFNAILGHPSKLAADNDGKAK
jgi:hypothetical protein